MINILKLKLHHLPKEKKQPFANQHLLVERLLGIF